MILGPVLFNICIGYLDDDGTKSPASNVTDDTTEGGLVGTPMQFAVIQRDLDRLDNYTDRKLMKLNSLKCQALQTRRNNPRHQ